MTTPIPSAALLGSRRLLLVKSTASAVEAELLKATVSKTIVVPAYTRKDGVVVPAHTKVVHYDPTKDVADVLSGKGSHSQKQAHKKLSKLGHWESLEDSHKLAHILSSATNIQQKASASAAVSGWKASMLAGKKPTASQQAAFDALPADKQAALQAEVGKPVAAPVTVPVTAPVAAATAYQAVPHALGGLGNEGPVIHVDAPDYAAVEKALGLEPGSLEGEDSTTYTIKNAAGETFSVYKHGGGLSVRTSGANKDTSSALALADHLAAIGKPAEAAPAAVPLVTGADGQPKVFYHGGTGNVDSADLKPLTFFTSDKDTALSYVGNNSEDEKLHAVHLAIGKVATPEDVKAAANKVGLTGDDVGVDEEYHAGYEYLSPHLNPHVEKVLAELKKQGFDGAHFPTDFKLSGELMPGGSWVVFGKGQVMPASGDHGLQGVGAWAHLSQYKSQHPMFITAQAKAWLADNPGKGAELSSTLVDLGHLDIAKKLGIYTPPNWASLQEKSSALAGVLKDPVAAKMHASMNVSGGWYANLDDASKAKWLAENAKADAGPKEGDTKPAADGGTLVLKDGHWVKQEGPASSSLSGYKVTEDVNAVPMVHATTGDDVVASIKQSGFNLSSNSMYGKGVYFSDKDLSQSGGKYKTSLQVKLKPHKQLVLGSDLEVATALQKITGLSSGHLGSDKAREAFLSAGIGSLRFPVDGETYTVVLDPALIELPKPKLGRVGQGLKEAVKDKPAPAAEPFKPTLDQVMALHGKPAEEVKATMKEWGEKMGGADKLGALLMDYKQQAAEKEKPKAATQSAKPATPKPAEPAPSFNVGDTVPAKQLRTLKPGSVVQLFHDGKPWRKALIGHNAVWFSKQNGDQGWQKNSLKPQHVTSFKMGQYGDGQLLSEGSADWMPDAQKTMAVQVLATKQAKHSDAKAYRMGGTLVVGEIGKPFSFVWVDEDGKWGAGFHASQEKKLASGEGLSPVKLGGSDSGPKDGDTKQGADGATLVLKDGHWVKQGGEAPKAKQPASLAMPDFEDGKEKTGVKAHYEKVGQKVLDLAAAGDAAGLEKLKADGLKPNSKGKVGNTWKGKTQNSKLLLALHDQALAHAKGNTTADQPAQAVSAEPVPAPAAPAAEASPIAASKLTQIPWDAQLLPAENSNAKSHNGQVAKIKAMAEAGDVAGLQAYVDAKASAKQTYAKKQHLLAATALAALKEGGAPAAPAANPLTGMSAADAIAINTHMPQLKLKEAWIDANADKVGAQAEWAMAVNPAPANPARLAESQKKMIDDIAKWPDGKYHLLDIVGGGNPAAAAYAQDLLDKMSAASSEPPKPPTDIKYGSDAFDYLADAAYGLEHKDLPTLQDVITALQGDKPAPGSDADKVLQFAKDAYKHVAGAAPAASKPADPTVAELAPMMEAINSAGSEEGAKKAALRYLNAFPGSQLAINQVNDALMMAGYKDLATAHAQKGQPGIENYQPKVAPAAGPIEVKAAVFHHTEDGHNKFWAVSTSGTVVKTTYGKIGSKGQTTEKTFGTVAEADAYAAKIGKEKQGKGYKYAGTTTHEYDAPASVATAAVVSKPAKPQFDASMHDDYQKTADSFESYINDGNVDQLKLHYWSLSSSMDPGTKQLVAYAKAGLESLGVHPAYFAYNLGSKFVPESFKTKKQEMLAAVAAGDKAKVAAMKVGNTFYLKQAKAAYLNAFSDLQQDGPKEGDVKQGADGMLVLKDGHWVKMSDKEVTAAVNGWQQAIINESVPTKAQAMVMEHIKSKDENKFLDALHESLPYAMSGDDDGFDEHAEELYAAAMAAHKQALSGGAATPAPAAPAAKDSAAWQLTMKDPSFSGVNTLMADMDGLSVYIAYEPESATFEVGQIHPGADEPEADHFSDPKKALDYLASMYGASVEMPSLGQVEKLTGKVSGATYSPKVPTPDNYVSSSGTGYEAMDGWKQTGPQGGSNPGGRFRDEFGVEWYCKFPADEDIAKSEVLAAKLYAALGISGQDCKLVTKGGKVGIASRWIDVKKGTADQLAKLDGTASGFAADAWLANHDVVGLAFDNLQIGPDGKAHRVDAGGSLQYRAQGGKKAFGPTVSEIDSLRDPAINSKSAAVFGKMTEADITASVAKVLALPDSAITNLVNQYGPGSDADKLALAQTLIARKADLAKKYPKAAKAPKKRLDPTNLPVDAAMLPKPHDFENWNGPGQGLSSKAHVNKANAAIEYQILGVAQMGNLPKLQAFEYAQIDKETGQPNGKMLPIANHPSKHVVQYHADLVTMLDEMANPPEPLKVFQETDISTLEQLSAVLPPKKFGTTVDSVKSNEKLGFWVVLGVAPGAVNLAPKKFMAYSQAAIAAGYEKYKQGTSLAKHFIKSVQASGSYNDLFRNGKKTDHSGNLLSDVAKAALQHATTQPEGTSLYRWQKMTDAMVQKIMAAPEGTVFQATGPMCTSYDPTATKHFGTHRVTVRYAKGAKAVESFGSNGYQSEKEVTTLPNSRFVILKRNMVPDVEHGNPHKTRLELEVLMLPPDLGL